MGIADGNSLNSAANAARGKARRNPAGGGKNSKGSWAKGRKGLFQFGVGQYGFINPSGQIDWSADASKAAKAPLFGWGSVQSHAKKSGQVAPRQNILPAIYETPGLRRDQLRDRNQLERDSIASGLQSWNSLGVDFVHDPKSDQFGKFNKFDNSQSDYAASLNAITNALNKQMPTATSNISGSGFDPSEGAGAGVVRGMIDDADDQSSELRRVRENSLAELSNSLQRAGDEFRELDRDREKAAQKLWKDEHPGKAMRHPVGFSVKNVGGVKQYFYTNKDGVQVSADPVKARKAIAANKKKPAKKKGK